MIDYTTLRKYDTVFSRWWEFSTINNIDPYAYNLAGILSLIKTIFDKDGSYSTINIHRAALSLFMIIPEEDKNIFKKFYKGLYNLKPPMPKYKYTWDPAPVLDYLQTLFPLEGLSLEKLTYELVMLVALTSAHRLQTLSLIKIENIKIGQNVIEVRIPDMIKTSKRNKEQPILCFPFIRKKLELCVASVICHYLEVTTTLRELSEMRLFLTIKKPHKAASTQTLSRWLKNILSLCKIDTKIFKGYSCRHAATSAAARGGLNIGIIRETAGWTKNSEMFRRFYNRPLARDYTTFATSILAPSNS
ncbi:hypothetical protein NQ315_014292 [Exocentrus adspersus]|uniref:Tyr recombinase domain-containing protein n=1 Tax=Exocentrus adspersus TaxID=1586481 RepID=A0AAV8VJW3_9CUCU|nr:hypothetical protein NQ315_014292 [Exocentrus adspersus]